MALVGCAIANNGVINQPYLVKTVRNASGEIAREASVNKFKTPISADVAARTAKVLEGVVKRGTGTAAAINGVTVAGKTGTAEKGGGKDDN